MQMVPGNDVYSPDEIARAAGVPLDAVLAVVASADSLVAFDDAVRIGRTMRGAARSGRQQLRVVGSGDAGAATSWSPTLFSMFSTKATSTPQSKSVTLMVSSTVHVSFLAAAMFIATLGLTPKAAVLPSDDRQSDPMRLVFLATPGPGGGGGGGGLLQKPAPPKAKREGQQKLSSPVPRREPPKAVEPAVKPPEPKPAPLNAEQLPAVVAPIIAAPADTRTRIGVLEQTTADNDSHGSGRGGGAGTGTGTGLGQGEGPGVGPGSGGGTGGGPYRPGSGITPPRLLREVKADYTEDARRRAIVGEVVLQIVVRRDGSVGDVRMLKGLGYGLDDRAVQAVRQWRFAPAERQGTPVDVMVEVSVEFRLR
jgi:TonB family protein